MGLSVVALAVATLAAGCGGEPGDDAEAKPAVDRSRRIDALERKVAVLRAKHREARAADGREAVSGHDRRADAQGALDDLVAGLPGLAGVTVGGTGRSSAASGGPLASGPAWSTIKVPIAQRVLEDGGGPDAVGERVRSQISAAITWSDNDAAAALFSRLEAGHGGLEAASGAVDQVLRAAGDATTEISTRGRDGFSTYGQTEWALVDQHRYLAALAGGCTGDAASREFLLRQMGAVGGSDTFGLGSTGLAGRWKGGWGPGVDGRYLVRQMGVVDAARGPVVVTMAAIPEDGTFETGQAMLDRIAARVVERFARAAPASSGC